MIQIIAIIFGLIVAGKLFLISIKANQLKNLEKKLAPNITFQPNKIFVRNNLFEKIIKSCKATNLEFLKLKGKLGSCLYEDICDEKDFILMSEENFKQHDVENKQLKEENENEKLNTGNEKVETKNQK